MPLNAPTVRSAQPKEKDYKLFDERGLYLLVKKNGAKYWRMKYRHGGKEKLYSIGVFPEVTLNEARMRRDKARALLRDDIDPSANKQAKREAQRADTESAFEIIAREWLEKRGKKSESGDQRLKRILEKDLYPTLGPLPVNGITPPKLLATLRKIEDRGAIESAHRAKQIAGQVFRYAIATGRAERDPSADLKGALATKQTKHFAAITDPKGAGQLMAAIDSYEGTPTVKAALKLSALLFCRQGELRYLKWEEINWDENRIELPAERMKTRQPHIIPLSKQALGILKDLNDNHRRGEYVFPSARGAKRPLSENGVRVALRTLGYTNDDMTPHGFRAMARTLLDEELNYKIEWIEQQLAHAVKDVHGRAYNRTKHLEQRKKMMQHYSDYLDALGAKTLENNIILGDFTSAKS